MANRIPVKFSVIQLTWGEGRTESKLTMHNVSEEDALRRAAYFGYKKPKWYQFWRKEIAITKVI